MIMSTPPILHDPKRTRFIAKRVAILRAVLLSVGFVNVDIIYIGSDRQVVIKEKTATPRAAAMLEVIDPILARWLWLVVDVWQNELPPRGGSFVQIRIDVDS
jgi:hypothetical protein